MSRLYSRERGTHAFLAYWQLLHHLNSMRNFNRFTVACISISAFLAVVGGLGVGLVSVFPTLLFLQLVTAYAFFLAFFLFFILWMGSAILTMSLYDTYQDKARDTLAPLLGVSTSYNYDTGEVQSKVLRNWMYLPLPLDRKVALIKAKVAYDGVMSSDVLRLSIEDLTVMQVLQREKVFTAFP